jgi:hypothetical protein
MEDTCPFLKRVMPCSQGFLYTLLKSEPELDHTTNLLLELDLELNHATSLQLEPKRNMVIIIVLYIRSKSGIFPFFNFVMFEVVIIHETI